MARKARASTDALAVALRPGVLRRETSVMSSVMTTGVRTLTVSFSL